MEDLRKNEQKIFFEKYIDEIISEKDTYLSKRK